MKKYNITVNGNTYEVVVEEVSADGVASAPVSAPVAAPKAATSAPKKTAPAGAKNGVPVTSPMPGTILAVKVTAGQSVKKGDTICVLEAMKMENDIPAPCDGTIASINTQKGASVASGDLLASIN